MKVEAEFIKKVLLLTGFCFSYTGAFTYIVTIDSTKEYLTSPIISYVCAAISIIIMILLVFRGKHKGGAGLGFLFVFVLATSLIVAGIAARCESIERCNVVFCLGAIGLISCFIGLFFTAVPKWLAHVYCIFVVSFILSIASLIWFICSKKEQCVENGNVKCM